MISWNGTGVRVNAVANRGIVQVLMCALTPYKMVLESHSYGLGVMIKAFGIG